MIDYDILLAYLRLKRDEFDTAIRVVESIQQSNAKLLSSDTPRLSPKNSRPHLKPSKGIRMLHEITEGAIGIGDGWMSRKDCARQLGLSDPMLTEYKKRLGLQERVHYIKNGDGSNRAGERWNLPALKVALNKLTRRVVKQTHDVVVPAAEGLAEYASG